MIMLMFFPLMLFKALLQLEFITARQENKRIDDIFHFKSLWIV